VAVKPTRSRRRPRARAADTRTPEAPLPDARAVDELYGLEPVFEPGGGEDGVGTTRFVSVACPYCGEPFETLLDLSEGTADYIEDCQVCCRPIQFHLEVDHEGQLERLALGRTD
jgi:hypothetical protein